ncbi:MAG: hypothetical protein ABSH50_13590 [Bryobacteraceae bacterium]|jgi:hypothetical protein
MSIYRWLAPVLWSAACAAATPQYNITTLLIQGQPIPGSTNTWNVNPGPIPTMPFSISGNYFAFVQCTCNGTTQPTDGIWVEDWSTLTFTQLVAPGETPLGTNETALSSFGGYALVSGEWVVFLGYTSGGNGFYSVPLKGGSVRVIADQNTILPGLGGPPLPFNFGNSTGDLPQADGVNFVFYANAGSAYGGGLFIAQLNGAGLAVLANSNAQVVPAGLPCGDDVYNFTQPRVAGSNVALAGSLSYLFVTPLTGFPTSPTCSPEGYLVYPDTVAYNTPLPGEPSTEGFDGSYIAIDEVSGQYTEYFEASGDGSQSLFLVNGSGITPIVNSTQSLPGVGPPYAPVGGTQGIAAQDGILAFSVGGEYGSSPYSAGLYTYSNGEIARVAVGSTTGAADILGGFQGYAWPPPIGPNSIGSGRMVFSFGNPEGIGIFLASPATCAADVSSEVSVTQAPPRYNSATGQYVSKVTVHNTSGSTLAAPVSAVFDGLTNVVANYGTVIPELLNHGAGATTCLSPLGEAYLVLNGGKAMAPGDEVSVELSIAYPAPPATFSYSTRVVTGKTR